MFLPTDPFVYLAPLSLVTLLASFIQIRRNEADLAKKKREMDQKVYETIILKEIGDRIGYELKLEKILDTLINSLSIFLSYSAVGYMLVSPDETKIDLRFHLEEKVSRKFLDNMRDRMLAALNQAAEKNYLPGIVTEDVGGLALDNDPKTNLSSLWLVPLLFGPNGLGVLAIANKKRGFYRGQEMDTINQLLEHANRAMINLEKVIQTEEGKVNSMVESMADGVIMLDKNLGLLVINPAADRLLDMPVNGQKTILDVAAKLSNKLDLRAKIEESLQGDKLVIFDNLTVNDKVSQVMISPAKNASGEQIGTVVLFHDVTATKALERLRDDFTAMMVHELRAPLTVVRGTADMFLRNPALSQQQQGVALLGTMKSSATSMLDLVNDLLDAAKIEAGKFQIIRMKSDLAAILRDRLDFFTQLTSPKSINLTLSGAEGSLEAEFDRDRIAQVLNNLISNAIKFTPAGGKIEIAMAKVASPGDIHWRFTDNQPEVKGDDLPAILVSVSDSGAGMAPDMLPQLFSKFKQLRPSSDHIPGTGLGLVIARGIVESHGGHIYVQSRLNEGTTFYFTIPLSSGPPAGQNQNP